MTREQAFLLLPWMGKSDGQNGQVSVAGTGGLVADASHIASRSDVLVDQSWENLSSTMQHLSLGAVWAV